MVMLQSAPEASRSHPLKEILTSRKTGWRIYRFALLTLLVAAGIYNLTLSLKSLSPEFVYRKDIIQEYLMARAVLAGAKPYLPWTELSKRFIGTSHNNIEVHPTPHPPPMALISLPSGLLTYQQAAVLWFLIEMFCLISACYWLVRWLTNARGWLIFWQALVFALGLLAWRVFLSELANGQIMIILLLLLVGAWQNLLSGKNLRGGILLGGAVALKLIAWPLVVFLALKRNWRAFASAMATVLLANFLAGLIIGFDQVLFYYLRVGPMVANAYRSFGYNFSTWTFIPRVFSGTGSCVLYGIEAPPLVDVPELARLFSFILPSALFILGMRWACRLQDFNLAWGMLICVSVLISPVAWMHYLTLAVLPAALVGLYLSDRQWPPFETNAALVVGVALFVSVFWLTPELYQIIQSIPNNPEMSSNISVPFWLALASLSPAVALGGLLWLLGRLDRQCPEETFR